MSNYVERFPKPAGECPPHPGHLPTEIDTSEFEWHYKRVHFLEWHTQNRRHLIALAMDEMKDRPASPEKTILMIMAASYLEGTLPSRVDNLFKGLFDF